MAPETALLSVCCPFNTKQIRRRPMKTIVKSQLPVLALEIDEEGTVAQKSMQMTRQGQLENTLLDALYPGIRVATVAIPGEELDDYGRAKVEQALAQFRVGGVEY